jgi:hypothetical protein
MELETPSPFNRIMRISTKADGHKEKGFTRSQRGVRDEVIDSDACLTVASLL